MILDNRALLSDKQVVLGAPDASTDVYDFGATGTTYDLVQLRRRLGIGMEIPFLIMVNQAFDNLTDLTITLQTDDDSAFGSPTNVLSVTVPLAELVAGYVFPVDKLPRKITERYFRVLYTRTGAAPTVGQITAGFVADVDGFSHL